MFVGVIYTHARVCVHFILWFHLFLTLPFVLFVFRCYNNYIDSCFYSVFYVQQKIFCLLLWQKLSKMYVQQYLILIILLFDFAFVL